MANRVKVGFSVGFREELEQMDNRVLYLNLVFSQSILFLIGVVLYLLFLRKEISLADIYHVHQWWQAIITGILFAVVILLLDIYLTKWLPKGYFDDGGINERLFRDVNIAQIALIALGVAFVEEWLFRGVLQNIIGLFWASIIFAGIHFRYFGRFFYALLVIVISFGFGFLYAWTESIWSVICAHFMIDFCLGILIRYGLLTKEEEI